MYIKLYIVHFIVYHIIFEQCNEEIPIKGKFNHSKPHLYTVCPPGHNDSADFSVFLR